VSYSPVDEQPGLSIEDIRISFWGARETTTLEKSIDGTMKQYFQSDSGYEKTKEWIQNGAPEDVWNSTIKPIFDTDCSTCHSKDAEVAGVVTETYQDVEEYLVQDTGKSPARLISLSHTHILAILPIMFLLVFVFSLTTFNEVLKTIIITFSFLSIIFDIGSWWLAKLAPGLAVFVILGGISVAISFLVLILLPLYEIWLKKS
jgi:hypothetical protein